MQEKPTTSGLEMISEDDDGAVWYDHDQKVFSVQWRDITMHFAPAKFEAFKRLMGKQAPEERPKLLVFPGGKS